MRLVYQMTLASEYGAGMEFHDEASMVRAAAGGDESAWRGVIDAYSRRVFAFIRSKCRDVELAEEITQSVFVTVAERLGSGGYDEQGKFEPWLFRIAINRLRDEIRRRVRRSGQGSGLALMDAEASGVARTGLDVRSMDALREALGGLGDADREIIHLRHHAGLSFKQIAAISGEPMGTLLARHHRALRKLRARLEEAGIDDAMGFGSAGVGEGA